MAHYTEKQKKAFNQGKKDGAKHGTSIEKHSKDHKAVLESYDKGVTIGKKSYKLNKKQNKKKVNKYQFIFDKMCIQDEALQNAKTKRVDTMLEDLESVLKSNKLFDTQKKIMTDMKIKAGEDKAAKKNCADYVMALVKNFHIKGSDDEENLAGVAMKTLNENVAASTKSIEDIRKGIYAKYIENDSALREFLANMEKKIPDDEIPQIVKAMKIKKQAIDREESKDAGKRYRKQQAKTRQYSESEGGLTNRTMDSYRSTGTKDTPGR